MSNSNKVYFPETIPDNWGSVFENNQNSASSGPLQIPDIQVPSPKIANAVVGVSIDTLANRILANFSFTQTGALQIGKYVNGTSGDLRLSANGLVGRNSSGTTTFAIDATTGNATFAGTLAAGVIVATGALTVGTNVDIGTAQTAGQVTTIVGNTVTTGFVNALNVTANSVNAGWVYAGNITASQIYSGTLTLGGSGNGNGIIEVKNSSGTTIGKWDNGGIKIYKDDANSLELYTSGGSRKGGIGTFDGAAYFNGTDLSLVSTTTLYLSASSGIRFDRNTVSYNGNDLTVNNAATLSKNFESRFVSGRGCGIKMNESGTDYTFEIQGSGANGFWINGNFKTAIMPTDSYGYRALYCVESPEVWFMDFTKEDKVLDPIFMEVTTGNSKWIKTEDGYQVWRKRKGADTVRFEEKAYEAFIQNEKFLSIPHAKD